jgi:hypothetical protein
VAEGADTVPLRLRRAISGPSEDRLPLLRQAQAPGHEPVEEGAPSRLPVGKPHERPLEPHARRDPLADVQGEVEPLDPFEQRDDVHHPLQGRGSDSFQIPEDARRIEPEDLEADLTRSPREQTEDVEEPGLFRDRLAAALDLLALALRQRRAVETREKNLRHPARLGVAPEAGAHGRQRRLAVQVELEPERGDGRGGVPLPGPDRKKILKVERGDTLSHPAGLSGPGQPEREVDGGLARAETDLQRGGRISRKPGGQGLEALQDGRVDQRLREMGPDGL